VFDDARLTQGGAGEGSVGIDGATEAIAPAEFLGCRDRSWGVRPVGAAPPGPGSFGPQFFWLWAPINFDDIMLERSYDGMQAYCQAKLAEVMLTIDQATELSETGVTVNCLHPAFNMPTKIVTRMFTPQSEIDDGVRSTVRLITDLALENVTGRYFDQSQEARALPQAYDERARANYAPSPSS